MTNYKCLQMKLVDIPNEIIKKFNLWNTEHNGRVHVEIRKVFVVCFELEFYQKNSKVDCECQVTILPLLLQHYGSTNGDQPHLFYQLTTSELSTQENSMSSV